MNLKVRWCAAVVSNSLIFLVRWFKCGGLRWCAAVVWKSLKSLKTRKCSGARWFTPHTPYRAYAP